MGPNGSLKWDSCVLLKRILFLLHGRKRSGSVKLRRKVLGKIGAWFYFCSGGNQFSKQLKVDASVPEVEVSRAWVFPRGASIQWLAGYSHRQQWMEQQKSGWRVLLKEPSFPSGFFLCSLSPCPGYIVVLSEVSQCLSRPSGVLYVDSSLAHVASCWTWVGQLLLARVPEHRAWGHQPFCPWATWHLFITMVTSEVAESFAKLHGIADNTPGIKIQLFRFSSCFCGLVIIR